MIFGHWSVGAFFFLKSLQENKKKKNMMRKKGISSWISHTTLKIAFSFSFYLKWHFHYGLSPTVGRTSSVNVDQFSHHWMVGRDFL